MKSRLSLASNHSVHRTTARTPLVQAAYDARRKQLLSLYGDNVPCPFCHDVTKRTVFHDFGTMMVINNDFPYAFFDQLPVDEHLMLVPRRHVQAFGQFNEQEEKDYWRAYMQFNKDGFNTMTRSVNNHHRSIVGHLHTHLVNHKDQ